MTEIKNALSLHNEIGRNFVVFGVGVNLQRKQKL